MVQLAWMPRALSLITIAYLVGLIVGSLEKIPNWLGWALVGGAFLTLGWAWKNKRPLGSLALLTVCFLGMALFTNFAEPKSPQAYMTKEPPWLVQKVTPLRSHLLSFTKQALFSKPDQNPVPYAVVASLVLGDRNSLKEADHFRKKHHKPPLERSFRDAGIFHILSVSGFHLVIVGYLSYRIFSKIFFFIPRFPQNAPMKKVAALITILVVNLYALIVGAETATLRAACMTTFMLISVLCSQRADLQEAFAISVLCLVGPFGSLQNIKSISLQLSVAALFGIAYLHPLPQIPEWQKVPKEIYPENKQGLSRKMFVWLRTKLIQGLDTSLAAMMMTSPLCAYYFFQFQAASPLGNFLALPLGEIFLLPLGCLGLTLGMFSSTLGILILKLAGLFAEAIVFVTDQIAALSLSWNVPKPTFVCLFLWYLGCLVLAAGKKKGWLLCMGGLFFYLLLWLWPAGNLRVTFLDVGQGDAIVIEFPGRKVAVVDGGGGFGNFDSGKRIVGPFLRSRGYQAIDLMVATHPHMDHIQGLLSLVEEFRVKEFWTAELIPTIHSLDALSSKTSWQALLHRLLEQDTLIQAPYPIYVGSALIKPLFPCIVPNELLECKIGSNPSQTPNNNSIVLQVGYAGKYILLTGDIEEFGEQVLSNRYQSTKELDSDLLKASHHCSRTGTGKNFLSLVSPEVAICSLGRKNMYGFPHAEVLRRLEEQNIAIYRTDKEGTIQARIDPKGTLSLHVLGEDVY